MTIKDRGREMAPKKINMVNICNPKLVATDFSLPSVCMLLDPSRHGFPFPRNWANPIIYLGQ